MSDDLVSRLKSPEVFISIGGMTSPVAHEAADRIKAQAAEITRLRAALATARRDALAEIKQDTDELIEQGRQDGMEYAAKIAENCAADWAKSAIGKYINSKWDFQSRAEAGEEIAAAILAAAKEGKP